MKHFVAFLLAAGLVLGLASGLRADTANVGKQIPALELNFALNAAEHVGKPLLLEFWATWCPPCRKSIPHLNELFEKYKARGLVVIGVTDEDAATVLKFTEKTPMHYAVAVGDKKLGDLFGISGIPHAMLVDRTGKILWEGHPLELTDALIEKIL
jgi:thiol-disulfide isomerase/thioredoxin